MRRRGRPNDAKTCNRPSARCHIYHPTPQTPPPPSPPTHTHTHTPPSGRTALRLRLARCVFRSIQQHNVVNPQSPAPTRPGLRFSHHRPDGQTPRASQRAHAARLPSTQPGPTPNPRQCPMPTVPNMTAHTTTAAAASDSTTPTNSPPAHARTGLLPSDVDAYKHMTNICRMWSNPNSNSGPRIPQRAPAPVPRPADAANSAERCRSPEFRVGRQLPSPQPQPPPCHCDWGQSTCEARTAWITTGASSLRAQPRSCIITAGTSPMHDKSIITAS